MAAEFAEPLDVADARRLLAAAPGVRVVDDPAAGRFPTPPEATGQDAVLASRLRQDMRIPHRRGIQLLCCGDQLRKGAALNAAQIAQLLP